MARGRKEFNFTAKWQNARAQFAAAEARFVDTLRAIPDADELAKFAAVWYADPRPEARQLLHRYLRQPLAAFRHEPLVKRLFKLAEAAHDDVTMAHFLVALDRSVRFTTKTKKKYTYENRRGWGREVIVTEEQVIRGIFSEMPKHDWIVQQLMNPQMANSFWIQRQIDPAKHRLFSGRTRNYLRRRAWRYFRKMGRLQPEKYVSAISQALNLYTDDDTGDGLALLANWGLIHTLFHYSPALVAKANGWILAPGQTLGNLTVEPYFNKLWQRQPGAALNLLNSARCRTVRQWAMRWLEKESPATLDALPLEILLGWLSSPDADLAEFAANRLRTKPGLDAIPVERWISIIESASADALDVVCELVAKNVSGDKLSLFEAVRLAKMRATPVAKLGLGWLAGKVPTSTAQIEAALSVREAEAAPIRPDVCRWAIQALSAVANFRPEWATEFLDSRHEDVREVGLEWIAADERVKESPTVWQRMLESPDDNIRLPMVDRLKELTEAGKVEDVFDPAAVRLLWATVLLNIHRGGRRKHAVVKMIADRLTRQPDESQHLLPILAVAVRSSRGTEFRTGLTTVVQLLETKAELNEPITKAFPELVREAMV